MSGGGEDGGGPNLPVRQQPGSRRRSASPGHKITRLMPSDGPFSYRLIVVKGIDQIHCADRQFHPYRQFQAVWSQQSVRLAPGIILTSDKALFIQNGTLRLTSNIEIESSDGGRERLFHQRERLIVDRWGHGFFCYPYSRQSGWQFSNRKYRAHRYRKPESLCRDVEHP